jgi:hypothetical protein
MRRWAFITISCSILLLVGRQQERRNSNELLIINYQQLGLTEMLLSVLRQPVTVLCYVEHICIYFQFESWKDREIKKLLRRLPIFISQSSQKYVI